jgi:hypothetical protein
MNLGVRTFGDAAWLDLTLRDSAGTVKGRMTRVYLPGTLSEKSAPEIFGVPLAGNDSLSIAVQSGSAIVYSVAVDGSSGDTSYHLARA